MRITAGILITVLATLLASCGYLEMADKLIPKEESTFAQHYLERLRAGDFDHVRRFMDAKLQAKASTENLHTLAQFFPDLEPVSIKLIGSQVVRSDDVFKGSFTFEYEFPSQWVLAGVVLTKRDEQLSVLGFQVIRTTASQQELNRFTLTGKNAAQYAVLLAALAVPIFILVTAVACLRTPIPRRRWLWVIFILLGVGTVSTNWATGEVGFVVLNVQLFGAAALAAGPYSPWVISAAFPLGAVMFWLRRRPFSRAAVAPTATGRPEDHSGPSHERRTEE